MVAFAAKTRHCDLFHGAVVFYGFYDRCGFFFGVLPRSHRHCGFAFCAIEYVSIVAGTKHGMAAQHNRIVEKDCVRNSIQFNLIRLSFDLYARCHRVFKCGSIVI